MVQAFGSMTFGFAALSLAISAVGVLVSIRVAERVGVMDVPNKRSSHSLPTPRMGGVPMVVAAAARGLAVREVRGVGHAGFRRGRLRAE